MKFVITVSLGFLFSFYINSADARRAIVLDESLTQEVNELLGQTVDLQTSFYNQNENEITASLNQTLKQIDDAKSASLVIEEYSRSHLNKILDAAKSRLELTQTTQDEIRRRNLKSAFEQLAHLARIYKVDNKYRIFFCPKDRSSWVQTGWKAKNPINPETLGSCGKAVK